MQTVSSKIWSHIAISNSYYDNYYTRNVSNIYITDYNLGFKCLVSITQLTIQIQINNKTSLETQQWKVYYSRNENESEWEKVIFSVAG